MLVLLYVFAAVASAALAFRVPREDRRDPVQRELTRLTWTLAATWLTWAFYLVSRSLGLGIGEPFRWLNGAVVAFLPWALLRFVDRLFPAGQPDPMVPRLGRAAPVVGLLYVVAGAWWASGHDGQGPADIAVGVYVFCALLYPLYRLWRAYRLAELPADRARIRYLLGLAGAAVGFSSIEAILRGLVTLSGNGAVGPLAILDLAREIQLTLGPIYAGQGPFPPLGALFATLCLYFLYQIVAMSRLLELNEIFGRLASVALQSLVLVIVLGVLGASAVSTMILGYPQQALYEAFIATSLLVLGAEPLRAQIDAFTDRVFNRRRQVLLDAVRQIDTDLRRVIAVPMLVEVVLSRLIGSGRIPYATVYLWDERRRAYRLVGERGEGLGTALPTVPRQPFADGFAQGELAYASTELRRRQARGEEPKDALEVRRQTMEAMGAELCVPLVSGDVVLGWVGLRDEPSSDGFARDEAQAVFRGLHRAVAVMENLEGFDALKEEYRLAALGTMSAGLAHEIRNPLAAIKGAAQLIRAGGATTDVEMVDIVVKEVDRLNTVVTQFLDYSRPLQLRLDAVDVGELVRQTARLLQQTPLGDVQVTVLVEPDLPEARLDGGKVIQVLLNLGQNALQAMRKSGGTLTFTATAGELRDPKARRARAVEIRVTDTGVGIAPEDVGNLFVPFFTTRHDGTGLGLAISRRIVREHGGELDLDTALGRGTTFFVRLPLEP